MKFLFTMFAAANSQFIPGSQVDPSGHGCIIDGGYQWCEEMNTCVRSWEVDCPSLMEPVVDECSTCPPPIPCPEPYIPNIDNCRLNSYTDNCGCQTRCPSYDCRNVVTSEIPDNCATWHDGCNTCQVRDGRAEICTLMYCFTQDQPYCMSYHIQPQTLNIGDVCYRFCEDGSEDSINRRSDCPKNTICKSTFNEQSISMISYDSCDNRAWTCQTIAH